MTSNNSPLIHACKLMKHESQYLELVFPGGAGQRWLMRGQQKTEPHEDDPVRLQVVAFCPYCGLDLRSDLKWQILGKAQFNALLQEVASGAHEQLQVEVHGTPDQARELLNQLIRVGAREVVGYAPVPIRGVDGSPALMLTVTATPEVAEALRRLPIVAEAYPDVKSAPFQSAPIEASRA